MTSITYPRHTRLATWICLALATLLVGCGGGVRQATNQPTPVETVDPTPVQPQFLSLALPPSIHEDTFRKAEEALAHGDWMTADTTLTPLASQPLDTDEAAYLNYLRARGDYLRGEQKAAMARLQTVPMTRLHPALSYRILSFLHHMLELERSYLAAAQHAHRVLQLGALENAADWRRSLWRDLQRTEVPRVNREEIGSSSAAERASIKSERQRAEYEWQGWLSLARISRNSGYSRQLALQEWREQHPEHPAAHPLPGGLEYLLSAPPWSKVALMLPLTGRLAPAGKALLDGYLAAYYEAAASGGAPWELLVLDTEQFEDANSAYDQAVQRGANIALGPLAKDGVAELATRLQRPIPTLALNRIGELPPADGSALVQLALASEDEGKQLAELAFGNGYRRGIVLHPDSDWGKKVAQALTERWQNLGAKMASSGVYSGQTDYSQHLQAALGLTASEARARSLRSRINAPVEFKPRRRNDFDVIFLLARNAQEARSIKPLLAFHYAGDVPVYAISSAYNGIPSTRDRDLAGMRLLETPWVLGANPGLRVAITTGATASGNYPRLNALGADAFLLQSEFARLQGGPDALLRGNTGLLSMDPQLRIRRELLPAKFDGGVVKAQ